MHEKYVIELGKIKFVHTGLKKPVLPLCFLHVIIELFHRDLSSLIRVIYSYFTEIQLKQQINATDSALVLAYEHIMIQLKNMTYNLLIVVVKSSGGITESNTDNFVW